MSDYNLRPPLLHACRHEVIRLCILSLLFTTSLSSVRLTSSEFSNIVTTLLFAKIRLTFAVSSLSRQYRIETLKKIGHHIRNFTFTMHHSDATFLPPLLNPKTGQEINFVYTPDTSKDRSKYGNRELREILMTQYPPLFHTATNVPAFVAALSCMPNIEHIFISCPDQDPAHRYRRSAVDYALISLRIAIERAALPHLSKLSLAVHPAALLYLHHAPSFGALPSALKTWKQNKNLKLSIDSWPFENAPKDHLKLLTNYLRVFAGTVENLTFHWYGQRGPCPLTSNSGQFIPTKQKLFGKITRPSVISAVDPLYFENLRRVEACNTHTPAFEISSFIKRHASFLKRISFDNVVLTTGTWDDALAPFNQHHDPASSSIHSFHCIKDVEDQDQVFLATPPHNRAMPSVPAYQKYVPRKFDVVQGNERDLPRENQLPNDVRNRDKVVKSRYQRAIGFVRKCSPLKSRKE